MYVFKGDLVHFCLEDLKCIIESQEPRMSWALCWPLGLKMDKIWFLVLNGKKGRWELIPNCLLYVRSFAQATSGLSQTI